MRRKYGYSYNLTVFKMRRNIMSKHLHILWTNSDPETSHNMVMMYATNGMLYNWWDQITVIIWGSTAKYVAEDEKIQERMKIATKAGVKFSACVSCANNLGVTKTLEDLDIEVIRWGEKLSKLMQNDEKVLSI